MRRAITPLLLAALCAGPAAPAAAGALPELIGNLGGTFGAPDAPGDGGLSLALSALWRFDGPFAFGPMVFADDLGTDVGRLRDPNDGTDLGATALAHGIAFGAAWRVDATGSLGQRHAWRPFASGTWGLYRMQADHLGIANGAASATGVSVAAGMRFVPGRDREPGHGAGIGLSVRHHRVFDDSIGNYTSVAMDCNWPLGGGAARVAGK